MVGYSIRYWMLAWLCLTWFCVERSKPTESTFEITGAYARLSYCHWWHFATYWMLLCARHNSFAWVCFPLKGQRKCTLIASIPGGNSHLLVLKAYQICKENMVLTAKYGVICSNACKTWFEEPISSPLLKINIEGIKSCKSLFNRSPDAPSLVAN